jgi:hypothetical protein
MLNGPACHSPHSGHWYFAVVPSNVVATSRMLKTALQTLHVFCSAGSAVGFVALGSDAVEQSAVESAVSTTADRGWISTRSIETLPSSSIPLGRAALSASMLLIAVTILS